MLMNFITRAIVRRSHRLEDFILRSCHQEVIKTVSEDNIMELKTVSRKLNALAPTTLAGSWDNVGLLVEPTAPHTVSTILLTNDLTELVMEEAISRKADMILSYHPPIFRPLKRLTHCSWKERIIIKCLENRIAVYSPHTSFDAVKGGVNDWLMAPFCSASLPIEQSQARMYATPGGYRIEITTPEQDVPQTLWKLTAINGVSLTANFKFQQEEDTYRRLSFNCTEKGLPDAVACINQWENIKTSMEILQLSKPPIPYHGPGRLGKLDQPTSIKDAVDKVKTHLKLSHVRLALGAKATLESNIKTVAVCAGSGSSVLQGVKADLYITGEMSHHEVLDANHSGATVILCDHSNTERGFLADQLQAKLTELFDNKISVIVSQSDKDPLQIV